MFVRINCEKIDVYFEFKYYLTYELEPPSFYLYVWNIQYTILFTKITKNINQNNIHNYEFELVKGSSHSKGVIDYIHLKYPIIDLLFIDGDHTKKGVLQDWDNYSSLIPSKGIVIFDDYWSGGLKDKAWNSDKMSFGDGTQWMDVVGAVDEIISRDDFEFNWKEIGLYGDKKIIQKIWIYL